MRILAQQEQENKKIHLNLTANTKDLNFDKFK